MSIRLLVIGEGERDNICVPLLVAGIVQRPIEHEFENWPRLHRRGSGQGLGRKLLFAMRQALDGAYQGLIATVDSDDCDGQVKLPELKSAREQARTTDKWVPAALGEPVPHLEAWLLDDPVAVRTAFSLAASTHINAPTKTKSPKDELNGLYERSGCSDPLLKTLEIICCELKLARCNHAKTTGFDDFAEDVEREIRPLYGP